jgi:integrase/recombinase XerD
VTFWLPHRGRGGCTAPPSGSATARGLRAAEVCHLRVQDIVPGARLRHDDRDRMMIHVAEGKGGRHRKAMLSPGLPELLRDCWREARPDGWLFPGLPRTNPISPHQLNRTVASAKHTAGLTRSATLCMRLGTVLHGAG